ncbi:tRNA-dihydrouridine synthase family protein [Coraliomargarita sp. SDUM461004]|uniref:tRNA-dihydrouridine synthase n=1 Tax=Thalassobacterium sedimentorum TaxID=3041258 RepID=A0ABU1AHE0_9BACT|nr:tRNA-dihydrouridine synthase family protein [Coraliomargarita sp. SDUM461004]MDQ8194237.1 tRNA-dihydrouridine synthase family protein [Coraliomargarita sp. SDUM461004]
MTPLPAALVPGQPWTALAPMQDVTTLPFMRLLGKYGVPDLLFTEYFRVHGHSTLESHIVDAICHHQTGRPVFAQLIGESLPDLQRTVAAIESSQLPVAGIDLNMGCPAPKVYKKNVGGGLLREPSKVDEVLSCLRAAINGRFTVKMRIGFDSDQHFETILDLIQKHNVDLLSLHARTVKEAYRSEVHYEYIQRAVERVPCPVLANGNITSVSKGQWVLDHTGSAGVMIGRSCIRNPWIFRQHREHFAGQPIFQPTLQDVREYIEDLIVATSLPNLEGTHHINHMKKFLNFVGLGVDTDGQFLHDMRRARTKSELDAICDKHLIHNGRGEQLFPDEPIKGLVARPNCETSRGCTL